MSIHSSSDNAPEHSRESSLDYRAMLSQGKHLFKQFYGSFQQRFSVKSSDGSNDPERSRDELQEIGDYLRQTRQEQGLSLEAIAQQTRISVRLLQSIEEANREELPEAVYLRGMIKRFADVLGIDGTELSHYLPLEEEKKGKKRSKWQFRLPFLQLRPIHLYFLYILLVVVAVQSLSNLLRQATIEAQGEQFPILPEEPSLVQENVTPTPTQPIAATTPIEKDELVVDIQLKAECRLKVIVDGEIAFDGVLPQGTHRTWKAKERLTVRADDAGKVMIVLNEGKPRQLGQPGQLQEVTYQASPQS